LQRALIIYVFKGEKSLSTSIIEHIVERDEKLIDEIKARTKVCVDAVARMDRLRDSEAESIGRWEEGMDKEARVFADLEPSKQKEVRVKMKAAAEEMPRLPECQMKSKGKPKYCAGRDLCFGVRKRKKK